MSGGFISRGFRGRRREVEDDVRVPPGQYSGRASRPCRPDAAHASCGVEFYDRGRGGCPKDVVVESSGPCLRGDHQGYPLCQRSKLGTTWGRRVRGHIAGRGGYGGGVCGRLRDGGYTTNLPSRRGHGRKAWVAHTYEGEPLAPEHGGPARLRPTPLLEERQVGTRLRLLTEDEPGFWESLGYHNHGDPWREQRYWGD